MVCNLGVRDEGGLDVEMGFRSSNINNSFLTFRSAYSAPGTYQVFKPFWPVLASLLIFELIELIGYLGIVIGWIFGKVGTVR